MPEDMNSIEEQVLRDLEEQSNKDLKVKTQTLYGARRVKPIVQYHGIDPDLGDVPELHPIAERIKKSMDYKAKNSGTKLSWNGLANALHLSAGAPTNWKKGKVSKDTLEKIAEFTGVDFAWLVTGEGEIDKEHNKLTRYASAALAGKYFGPSPIGQLLSAGAIAATAFDVINKKLSDTRLKKALEELENEDPDLVEEIKQGVEKAVEKQLTGNIQRTSESQIRLVPLISFVQAGDFKEAIMNAQDEFVATYAGNLGGHAFALEVVGDSMYPEFKAKDKIIVDPDVDPIPGDYVIAQNGSDEATFKKYKPRGFDENGREYFELVPLNDNYPTLDSRFQDIKILATVIDHIRNLRR